GLDGERGRVVRLEPRGRVRDRGPGGDGVPGRRRRRCLPVHVAHAGEPTGLSVKPSESAGSQTTNVDPTPSSDTTSTWPPWRSTMSRTIVRPRPLRGSPSLG